MGKFKKLLFGVTDNTTPKVKEKRFLPRRSIKGDNIILANFSKDGEFGKIQMIIKEKDGYRFVRTGEVVNNLDGLNICTKKDAFKTFSSLKEIYKYNYSPFFYEKLQLAPNDIFLSSHLQRCIDYDFENNHLDSDDFSYYVLKYVKENYKDLFQKFVHSDKKGYLEDLLKLEDAFNEAYQKVAKEVVEQIRLNENPKVKRHWQKDDMVRFEELLLQNCPQKNDFSVLRIIVKDKNGCYVARTGEYIEKPGNLCFRTSRLRDLKRTPDNKYYSVEHILKYRYEISESEWSPTEELELAPNDDYLNFYLKSCYDEEFENNHFDSDDFSHYVLENVKKNNAELVRKMTGKLRGNEKAFAYYKLLELEDSFNLAYRKVGKRVIKRVNKVQKELSEEYKM